MNDQVLDILTFVAALGSGLVAGVFFAFSAFIMKALSRIPNEHGITAMQSINLVVINPLFLSVFVGTAIACGILFVLAIVWWQKLSIYIVAGSLFYLIGTLVVTRLFNIPRNDRLADATPGSEDGANVWKDYLRIWTVWNHVRTIATFAAAALFTIVLSS